VEPPALVHLQALGRLAWIESSPGEISVNARQWVMPVLFLVALALEIQLMPFMQFHMVMPEPQ
jgi:hypothetical protein